MKVTTQKVYRYCNNIALLFFRGMLKIQQFDLLSTIYKLTPSLNFFKCQGHYTCGLFADNGYVTITFSHAPLDIIESVKPSDEKR